MSSRMLTRFVAAGAAAIAVAIGGVAIANSSSSSGGSGSTNVAQAAAPGHAPRSGAPLAGRAPRSGQASQPAPTAKSGQLPANWRPGTGTIITGEAADKAKAAALAKYSGTVNRVMQLSDGSYAVHMFATSGPHHVFVNREFKVTGTA
ncbi:MAG TPA: hypothetical protein VNZ01_13850 [Solirubrobacteraceae bacterium]|jgi:hypothetical protein|nr:hypothetical protein [Solirubrobacteraceae bacterium]